MILKNTTTKLLLYYNRNAKSYPDFKEGEQIYFKKTPSCKWQKGKINNKLDLPRSYIVEDVVGSQYRRNSRHIMPDKSKLLEKDGEDSATTTKDDRGVNDKRKDNTICSNDLDTSEIPFLGF